MLHLFASPASTIREVLAQALQDSCILRTWDAVPARLDKVRTSDLVVVDLTDGRAPIDPMESNRLALRAPVVIVCGNTSINPEWLMLRGQVEVISWQMNRAGEPFAALITALRSKLTGPPPAELVELVLKAEPLLDEVHDLVVAVCEHPWRVRRPKDVVGAPRTRPSLRDRCRKLGFTRIEHAMVCVRAVIYESLVARKHLPISLARRIAGFGDWSNGRRQILRAKRGSRQALKRLRTRSLRVS